MPRQAIIKIDELERLAALQCTRAEAGAYFRVTEDAIKKALKKPEFREAWDRGKHSGLISLRRAQFQAATEQKNPALLIWLGKQLLGQRDMQSVEHSGETVSIKRVQVLVCGMQVSGAPPPLALPPAENISD